MSEEPRRAIEVNVQDLEIALGRPDLDMTDQIMKRFPLGVGKVVLEAGCGTGKLGMNLSNRTGCTIFLVDNDREALTRAHKLLFACNGLFGFAMRVVFERTDILHLPYGSDLFDLVFNEGVLEHFRDPRVLLNEMIRVSRDAICCIVPNAKNPKQVALALSQTEQYKDRPHHWASYEKPMSQEELETLFKEVGLKQIESTLVFPDRIPPQSRDDYRMVWVMGRKR